jgi:hypothetical protein
MVGAEDGELDQAPHPQDAGVRIEALPLAIHLQVLEHVRQPGQTLLVVHDEVLAVGLQVGREGTEPQKPVRAYKGTNLTNIKS